MEVFPLLARLKEKGHRIFVLSNTSPVFYELLKDQLYPLNGILYSIIFKKQPRPLSADSRL